MKWITSSRLRGRRLGQGLSARRSAPPTRRSPLVRTSPHWTRSRGPAGPVRLPPAHCSRLRFSVAKGEGPRLKRMAVSTWRGVPLQWRVSGRLGVVCYACTVCPFLSLNDPGPVYRHTLLTHPGRPHAFHCGRCGHSHNKVSVCVSVCVCSL